MALLVNAPEGPVSRPGALPSGSGGPPCILFEDDHLLVVNKPAGLNTHAPSPYAGQGLHEWLSHREPRWASLAIVHRLDKVTSGLIVFARTPAANRSLTEQFATRRVRKRYLLWSDRPPAQERFTVKTLIARLGDKYFANEQSGEPAETSFELLRQEPGRCLLAAYPHTGRTHQIRVHAASAGCPILGDELYGGAPFARVCLHASELHFQHPESGAQLHFQAPVDFQASPPLALRQAFIDPAGTDAFRILHGAGDERPGLFLDRWGAYGLIEGEQPPAQLPPEAAGLAGTYFKLLNRQVQRAALDEASPRPLAGALAPDPFTVSENGVRYEISFQRGYSVGLFLDQRDNRRRILSGCVAPGFDLPLAGKEALNAFAYTCGFSVCAALAGARCTSLDLSKHYLEWGRRNFALNRLDPAAHDFIYGDVFDWAPRLQKKGRQFDLILLDPPTFSRSKLGGIFQAERDYGKLVKLFLPLLRPGGVLFASANARKLPPQAFLEQIRAAASAARRQILREHYVPQPFDFPISKNEPAHLKTVWITLA